MASRIEQIIDEIEEYIDGCKYYGISNTKIIVNKEELVELLRELRSRTPDEIKRYQKIINNKEAILNDAKEKAKALLDEATAQTTTLISEHEIMQKAHADADEVIRMAAMQAQEIVDNATIEANQVKEAAIQYTDDILADAEMILSNALEEINRYNTSLTGELNESLRVIQGNRLQLKPDSLLDPAGSDTSDPKPKGTAKKGDLNLDMLDS